MLPGISNWCCAISSRNCILSEIFRGASSTREDNEVIQFTIFLPYDVTMPSG